MDPTIHKTITSFLSKETKKLGSSVLKKVLIVLIYASQNICINQACEMSGVYSHSKQILNLFKKYTIREVERFFLNISLAMFKSSIQKLNLRSIKLAIDITEEPYYGKLKKGDIFIWSRTPKSPPGATGCFKYLTISCTNTNCKLILANLLLAPGYRLEDIIPSLLDLIRKIIPIKQVTFDRGFHNNSLIYKLESLKIKYLIFCTKKEWSKEVLLKLKSGESCSIIRELEIRRAMSRKSFKAKFIIIKDYQFDKHERSYDWIFVTNLSFNSIKNTISSYRNRWGIETVFRVLKQDFRIKTTSKHQSVRLMCMCFSMLFYNIWQISKMFINNFIKAKSFLCVIRFGFKVRFGFECMYEKEILKFFGFG